MTDKPKRPIREDIFEVFRPQGSHDLSSENYLRKKSAASRTTSGPQNPHHLRDKVTAADQTSIEPHAVALSGADSDDRADCTPLADGETTEDPVPATTIRLETFRIEMAERLASMQVAQQKAKDQLSDLEQQHGPEASPPEA
jgi:hypothetical protein